MYYIISGSSHTLRIHQPPSPFYNSLHMTVLTFVAYYNPNYLQEEQVELLQAHDQSTVCKSTQTAPFAVYMLLSAYVKMKRISRMSECYLIIEMTTIMVPPNCKPGQHIESTETCPNGRLAITLSSLLYKL